MSIEVWEVKRPDAWAVYIDPFFDASNLRRGRLPLVNVTSREDFVFEVKDHAWRPASVGWSSLGSIDPDKAELFSKALTIAVEHAQKMDTEHGFSSPVVSC